MKITFAGATDTVTGSKHIITSPDGRRILLDCGLFQGRGADTDARNRRFTFNPASIDVLILSHAHIDHSGNIPLLVKQGFKGKIYCTPATYDLCEILLLDSAHIHEYDVLYLNKKRFKKDLPPIEPLYSIDDAQQCLSQFVKIDYNTWHDLFKDTRFMLTDAGHILGSAVVNLVFDNFGQEIRVCFTGDIGRRDNLLLKPFASFPQPDYIISEATYGDRTHLDNDGSYARLLDVIRRTCVDRGGKLLIPAFSLGRTQEIVFTLNNLKNQGLLPNIKVFVDSPLSLNATAIMRKHTQLLNKEVQQILKTDDDIFGFPNLFYIRTPEDSMKLNELNEPCIIISSSGMLDAGRIKHHLKNNIHDKNSCVLLVGYCTPESLGGKLKTGARKVRIFGQEYPVKIHVESIDEFSGHAGQDELLEFLTQISPRKVRAVFLVHGEDESKQTFKALLQQNGFGNIAIPELMQEFDI